MKSKIRVLLAHRSRFLRDLVSLSISDQPDMEVVGELYDDLAIEAAIAEHHPDFVIITIDKPNRRPALCDQLLSRYPQLKVLTIETTVNRGAFFWTVVQIQSATFESSEQSLLAVLRGKTPQSASLRVH